MKIRININYQKEHTVVFIFGANLISMAPHILPMSSHRAEKSCGPLNQPINDTITSASMKVRENPTVPLPNETNLDQNEPGMESLEVGGVMVGFSNKWVHPVVMQIEECQLEKIEEPEHPLVSTVFQTYPHGIRCGIDIIWHENLIVPGNFEYAKDGLRGRLEGEEQVQFNRKLQHEHKQREPELPSISSTIARVFPNNKAQTTKSRMRNLFSNITYQDIHFELKWPRLAWFKFPKAMITAMKDFLSQLKNYVISLNLALAATVIFFDLQNKDKEEAVIARENFVEARSKAYNREYMIFIGQKRVNHLLSLDPSEEREDFLDPSLRPIAVHRPVLIRNIYKQQVAERLRFFDKYNIDYKDALPEK
ncbi:uncharacterized protein FIESC28_02280 [Fusarium coffeatum]|uniref:Uncharacterized protein n=1 Tax=Fusarium coffeatum TaxID=231269 RepID=A0A366S8I9_9HYPO|nr:uncharacterized protein FIESC28_02280 [Fusarium coffeatum]RBR25010.1 hypothetical protein FIESC28_02280 [Fusarium coffeatum]